MTNLITKEKNNIQFELDELSEVKNTIVFGPAEKGMSFASNVHYKKLRLSDDEVRVIAGNENEDK